MSDSIFTKIINGEIPAHRIYENRHVLAILDIHPIRAGHTLVIPKKQIGSYLEMDKGDFIELMEASQYIAKHIQEVLGCKIVVLNIDGSDTPDHVHVHLVPINQPEESYREGRMEEDPDHDSLRAMAQKLKLEK
jgi:histidine triad (HIT) family protein